MNVHYTLTFLNENFTLSCTFQIIIDPQEYQHELALKQLEILSREIQLQSYLLACSKHASFMLKTTMNFCVLIYSANVMFSSMHAGILSGSVTCGMVGIQLVNSLSATHVTVTWSFCCSYVLAFLKCIVHRWTRVQVRGYMVYDC